MAAWKTAWAPVITRFTQDRSVIEPRCVVKGELRMSRPITSWFDAVSERTSFRLTEMTKRLPVTKTLIPAESSFTFGNRRAGILQKVSG